MKIKPLAIDLETSLGGPIHGPDSKDLVNDYYTMIYGSHPDDIEVVHEENGFNRKITAQFAAELKYADIVIGHNLQFDLGYLWGNLQWQKYIKRGGVIWCTQFAQYCLTGQRHKFSSLAELQEIHLGERVKDDRISRLFRAGFSAQHIIKARYTHKRVWTLYCKYCENDGSTVLRIFAKQYRLAKEKNMLKIIQVHQRGLLAIIMMQNTGICIDVDKCETTARDFRLKSLEYLQKATEIVAPLWDRRLGVFNIGSPKQKSAVLFGGNFTVKEKVEDGKYQNGNHKYKTVLKQLHINGFGLSVEYTRKGKKDYYSTDADVVNKIHKESDNEVAKEYCRLQKESMRYSKMCSTYLDPMINENINGVLFPHYKITHTVTGRLSSGDEE